MSTPRPDRGWLVEIDDVARGMTASRGTIDLRRRVLARLDHRPAPSWGWRLMPTMAAVAVVVIVAIAIAPRLRDRRAAAPTAPPASAPISAALERVPAAVPDVSTVRPADVSRASRGPATIDHRWTDRALPAVEAPSALSLERIQPGTIEIRPLVTTPLTMPPIDDDTNRERSQR